jgi:hypothetical protein
MSAPEKRRKRVSEHDRICEVWNTWASKDVDKMHVRYASAGFERAPTTVIEYDSHVDVDTCPTTVTPTTVTPTDAPPELTHMMPIPQTSIQGARS